MKLYLQLDDVPARLDSAMAAWATKSGFLYTEDVQSAMELATMGIVLVKLAPLPTDHKNSLGMT